MNSEGILISKMAAIESHQAKSPVRYRTAWAEAVGPEIASQSCLEKIDPNARIAFFRCFNSALSYTLQREPRFAQKLGQVLKQTIKQLKSYY